MPRIYNLGRKHREQGIWLNSIPLSGIQSVNFSYQSNQEKISFLGDKGIPLTESPAGSQNGNVSLQGFSIGPDPFIGFTGEAAVNGYTIENLSEPNKNYSFTSGFLTQYNSSCNIGSIPTIGATFSVLGNMGQLKTGESSQTISDFGVICSTEINNTGDFRVADPGNLEITLDDFETNRLLSYDLSLSISRNAQYILGSRTPKHVKINFPIEVSCSFQIEVDNLDEKSLRDSPFNESVENFEIRLKDEDGNSLTTHNFPNMKLVGQSFGTNIDGNLTLDAVYRTFIRPLNALDPKPALPSFSRHVPGSIATTGCADVKIYVGENSLEVPEVEFFCFDASEAQCDRGICISPTPTQTTTNSATPTQTPTNTPTQTSTETSTPTVTPTQTPSTSNGAPAPSPTSSQSSATPAPSNSASSTPTPTPPPPTPSSSSPVSDCGDGLGLPKTVHIDLSYFGGECGECGITFESQTIQLYDFFGVVCGAPIPVDNETLAYGDPVIETSYTVDDCCDARQARLEFTSVCGVDPEEPDPESPCNGKVGRTATAYNTLEGGVSYSSPVTYFHISPTG
jgi:hypothetical protein